MAVINSSSFCVYRGLGLSRGVGFLSLPAGRLESAPSAFFGRDTQLGRLRLEASWLGCDMWPCVLTFGSELILVIPSGPQNKMNPYDFFESSGPSGTRWQEGGGRGPGRASGRCIGKSFRSEAGCSVSILFVLAKSDERLQISW